jgi:hypothetical protein
MIDQRIKLIRECEWEEVFLEWYKNEGNDPKWAALAKERGHDTWADWRINGYAKRFECNKAEWGFYEVTDPATVIGSWYGGPFRSWTERHYDGAKTRSFSELVDRADIAKNVGIRSRMEKYPASTIMTALELPDGRIFVIEGMHRACALALMTKAGKPAPEKLVFAIGRSKLSELPPVGRNSSK